MKWRPQILIAMVILGIIAVMGLVYGYNEVTTGCGAGIIALGMKLLEGE